MRALRYSIGLLVLSAALFSSTQSALGDEPDKQAKSGSTTISVHATIPSEVAPIPLFLSGTLRQTVTVSRTSLALEARFDASVLQGEASRLTLELVAADVVENITGENVLAWAVRTTNERRTFLDISTRKPVKKGEPFNAVISVEKKIAPGAETRFSVPLFGASGEEHSAFSGTLRLIGAKSAESGTHFKVVSSKAFLPLGDAFSPTGTGEVTFQWDSAQRPELDVFVGVPVEAVSMENNTLHGKLFDERILTFTLSTTIVVREAGAKIPLLSGDAAVSDFQGAKGLLLAAHPTLPGSKRPGYLLSCQRVGAFPIKLQFEAKLIREGDITRVDFAIPAAQIIPFALEGFPEDVRFAPQAGIITAKPEAAAHFLGFLPMTGQAGFAWMRRSANADAAQSSRLFFTSEETTEISVRPGLLRQVAHFRYQILQGKLDTLRFALTGPGEILRVTGQDVLSWKIEETEKGRGETTAVRALIVHLASPKSGGYALSVDAQTPLGNFPVSTTPLGIAPQDGVRHGGFVLVHNEGAVRLEVLPQQGLTQVAPSLFPEKKKFPEDIQRFVYRVANASTSMKIHAANVLPETSVSLLALYQITENDLFIDVEMELDVREAPLPGFTLRIPADYSVSQTQQLDEWQYTVGPASSNDTQRPLHLNFGRPVFGRYLAKLRLEKGEKLALAAPPNQSLSHAASSEKSMHKWQLAPLSFPTAKSVRGHIGVIAAPGLRASTANAKGLTDIATSFFPRTHDGLQQAFRLRDTDWAATIHVEKLDLVVQSDCLHLFAVREGTVNASTTINYAIAGAPLGVFRFTVPTEARNIEFAGRDIRGWKRDGDIVEVTLHKPASGTFTLLGTYDLPLNPRGGELSLMGLQTLGVQAEQGIVLAVSNLQFDVKQDAVSGNLTALEPGEIPQEYRLMFDAPLLAAYQYSARPYKLQLGLVPRPLGDVVNQVVDFASLQTRVARDGQLITETRYMVKSHGHQYLRVVVPAGLKLWAARVGNTDVLPVMEGEATDHATALIPLLGDPGVNAIQQIDLRFGGSVANTRAFRLDAPALGAPVIQTRWELSPAAGMSLGSTGGNLAQQGAGAKASAWFKQSPERYFFLTALGVAALGMFAYIIALKLRRTGHVRLAIILGLIATLASAAVLYAFALLAWEATRAKPELLPLVFSASIHLPGSELFLELQDLADGTFWTKTCPALIVTAALVIRLLAWAKKSALLRTTAWALVFVPGVFSNEPTWLALASAFFFLVEVVSHGMRCFRVPKFTVMFVAMLAAGMPTADTAPAKTKARPPVTKTHAQPGSRAVVEAIEQDIQIANGRAQASVKMHVRGTAGDSFELLAAPAVLTRCELPEGAHIEKVTHNEVPAIRLILDKPGASLVTFDYELMLGEKADSLRLPTSNATQDKARITFKGKGLRVSSDDAVPVRNAPTQVSSPTTTTAGFFFLPRTERIIRWAPQERDRRAESLVTYVETANLYVPSLGILDGWHFVKIRPAQGLLSSVCLTIPEGLSIASVTGKNVGRWRFDPERHRLHVDIEPGQPNECTLLVETQAGIGSLPRKIELAPLSIEGAAGQVGMLALGVGDDVRILSATPQKMLVVSNEDFARAIASASGEKIPVKASALRQSFRYGDTAARLTVDVDLLTPEVRVNTTKRFLLGEDRVSLVAAWSVDITRAGVFRLSFELPESLEVEAISGKSLSHWTELRENGRRHIVMHLRGRTLGRQEFTLAFAGPGIAGKKTWNVPTFAPREASRQTGELTLVPEEGLRLHVRTRSGATQFDPGSSASLPKGTITFRLVQPDWKLALEMERLAPWMQASYLQDVTLRDGQTRVQANFEYLIENSAVKTLRVRLPAAAESVRFFGPLVEDAVNLGPLDAKGNTTPTSSVWEIRLQRRVIGKTVFQVTYQCTSTVGDAATRVGTVEALGAGLQHGWLALRTSGRLELKPVAAQPAVASSDWQSIPRNLRLNLTEPAAVLRMVENGFTLPLVVATHDPAKLLVMRVEKTELQTTFSAPGSDGSHALTRVALTARMTGKGLLRVTLPANTSYWNGFVNDEPVRVARDGNAFLLPVAPNPVATKPTQIEFYYAAQTGAGGPLCKLEGPCFDVPLENITWRVYLPEGYMLARYDGDLHMSSIVASPVVVMRGSGALMLHDSFPARESFVGKGHGTADTRGSSGNILPLGNFAGSASGELGSDSGKAYSHDGGQLQGYLSSNVAAAREIETQAEALLRLAKDLRSQGNQNQALQALNLANTLSKGNAALNEEARRQLESLRKEQIEVGMNRWRGKIPSQQGLSQAIPVAAPASPEPQGTSGETGDDAQFSDGYSMEEVERQRRRNTEEDNAIFRRMAERLLAQQRSVAGSPEVIRPLLPESGTALLFERPLQVSTSRELSVKLELATPSHPNTDITWWRLLIGALLLLTITLVPRCFPKKENQGVLPPIHSKGQKQRHETARSPI
ncbi:MAG: hypothetical protein LBD01_03025 [Puniceicoccales bacterium]|jgi:hypothetical protein|nr:hypothetical protein [Puniceicoccales bacterium]